MATVTSVVTIDTTGTGLTACEWKYKDVYGIEHCATNGQTFSITIENTASNIKWEILATGTGNKFTTTDGYTVRFRPSADGGNYANKLHLNALADSTLTYVLPGELDMECPVSGIIQHWHFNKFYTTNVDMNAAGVLGGSTAATTCEMEDQFGNVMTIPWSGSGITVAQAA